MEINLYDVAGGALQEKANQAFAQVMGNLQDPNTPWKNKRKINICLTFEQNEERTDCTCDISVSTKLAAVKPVKTKFCTGRDLLTGSIQAQEYGPGIKGQMGFEDIGISTGESQEAGTAEENIPGNNIMDFRVSKEA